MIDKSGELVLGRLRIDGSSVREVDAAGRVILEIPVASVTGFEFAHGPTAERPALQTLMVIVAPLVAAGCAWIFARLAALGFPSGNLIPATLGFVACVALAFTWQLAMQFRRRDHLVIRTRTDLRRIAFGPGITRAELLPIYQQMREAMPSLDIRWTL